MIDYEHQDEPLGNGWSFTESEEATFGIEESRQKTLSYAIKERKVCVLPHPPSDAESYKLLVEGAAYLASANADRLIDTILQPQLCRILSKLGTLVVVSPTDEDDRTLYFRVPYADGIEEVVDRVPEVLQATQPGYIFSLYDFAYCLASSEDGTEYLFLKLAEETS